MTSVIGLTRNSSTILLVLFLTLLAAIPRLYHLGEPGFYMDEETTAFASRSMAESGSPEMPSGMPYYRALPHTWLNSLSAKVFGLDAEFSYRLPSAVLGILTVPLLFLLARPYTGTQVAFIAALLLGLSEWHIITSRQARMYAPLLFFYIAFAFSVLRWSRHNSARYLVISAALYVAVATIHTLGIIGALIPLVTLFIYDYSTTPQYKIIIFVIVSTLAALGYNQFVSNPYLTWQETQGISSAKNAQATGLDLLSFVTSNIWLITQSLLGCALGIWLGLKSSFADSCNGKEFRIVSRYLLAILFSVLSATGNLHGALIAIALLLMLYRGSLVEFLRHTYKPLIIIGILSFLALYSTTFQLGFSPGLKKALSFPYPNWLVLFKLSPGITVLFILSLIYLSIYKVKQESNGMLAMALISLLPIVLVGIFKKWAAARYLMEAYPFILLLASTALLALARRIPDVFSFGKLTTAFLLTMIICLSGLLGGHGILQAFVTGTVRHGDYLNEAALIFPFYPDHKTPGRYVASHRDDDDIVIVEDVITQRWYAGEIDYWLRKHGSTPRGKFIYEASDGKLHDIYTNSIIVTPAVLDSIKRIETRKVWVITSGETFHKRDIYLNPFQRAWLENIESMYAPVYIGEDGITSVYCLNCGKRDI